eukprot:6214772-Pleurochrysis_carterae.AAC.5
MHRNQPPDRIKGPTARVPPPQAVTYAGKGLERVRDGGRRAPPGLDASSPISKERGARQPTRVLGDPVRGKGLINTGVPASFSASCMSRAIELIYGML